MKHWRDYCNQTAETTKKSSNDHFKVNLKLLERQADSLVLLNFILDVC